VLLRLASIYEIGFANERERKETRLKYTYKCAHADNTAIYARLYTLKHVYMHKHKHIHAHKHT